jgi:hypothetical protein
MAKDMKAILIRSGDDLLADAVGIIALAGLLIGALYLPLLF